MNKLKRELRLYIVVLLLKWALYLLPEGDFKISFSLFLLQNLDKLKENE